MEDIRKILETSKNIAVVGISEKPERPSYRVASYLMEARYNIIPVNPKISSWKGIKALSSLSEIQEKIDIVDIFRRGEFVMEVVKEAAEAGASVVWMQPGAYNREAAEFAKKSGMKVVANRCISVEHMKLKG